jgi:hypothetical protein
MSYNKLKWVEIRASLRGLMEGSAVMEEDGFSK